MLNVVRQNFLSLYRHDNNSFLASEANSSGNTFLSVVSNYYCAISWGLCGIPKISGIVVCCSAKMKADSGQSFSSSGHLLLLISETVKRFTCGRRLNKWKHYVEDVTAVYSQKLLSWWTIMATHEHLLLPVILECVFTSASTGQMLSRLLLHAYINMLKCCLKYWLFSDVMNFNFLWLNWMVKSPLRTTAKEALDMV